MLDSITGDIELSTKAANVRISCRESGNIDIKTGKGNPDCFMVDWDWVMSFPRALTYYESFIHPPRQSEEVPNNIYNLAAKNELGKLLGEDKYLDSLEPGQARSFDFSMKPENEWLKWSFNFISVPRQLLPIVDDWNFTADGLQCSLASFSFRALAAGQVEKMANDSYHIIVNHCWVFAHDEFSFEDDDYFFHWSCEEKSGRFGLLMITIGRKVRFAAATSATSVPAWAMAITLQCYQICTQLKTIEK